MRRIALTGGIATGKSYVTRLLRDAGVPVVDADQVARDVVAVGTPGLAAVVRRFGSDILTAEGSLDRKRLGSIVFSDAAARRALEAIVHPAVRQVINEFFARLPPSTPLAVADIPLLYETGRDQDFDAVIVAASDRGTQIRRVMTRDGWSENDARRRVDAQMPIDEKVARADHVIDTTGSYENTAAQVTALLARLRGRLTD